MYKMWFMILMFFGLLMFYIGLMFLMEDFMLFMDWEIFSLNTCSIVMTFLFDWMSLLFMSCVLLISSMVVLYSSSYMNSDMYKIRFLLLVLLFILSMMLMIISPNLVSILLGWDGLGLVSYCLVIYFQSVKSYNSGMLTILTNRIGDVAILIGIGYMMNNGSWNYIYYMNYYNDNFNLFVYMMILAAFTKSAQIPFSSWLPAAMAAPTPVSALVHSSTLVTAGVYLLIRFESLINNIDLSLFLLLSCLTMFMAGLGANFEYDFKKIIALSTLSQLGLMMSILFLGYSSLAFLHLLTHAFFKALLFLCAGLIIHDMGNSQDIRFMGYLVNQLPYTSICFSISSLSLCGLPFLSGFYSKDMILENMMYNYSNFYINILYFLSVGLTSMYSLRLVYYCMSGYNGLNSCQSYSEDLIMISSMLFLTLMAIFSGSMLMWLMFPNPFYFMFPLECKMMALFYVFLGGFIGYICSMLNLSDYMMAMNMMLLSNFLSKMWFMPYFSTNMLYSSLLVSKYYTNFMDMGWGEYLVSRSTLNWVYKLSNLNVIYQNNNIKIYMLGFLFSMMFYFFFL